MKVKDNWTRHHFSYTGFYKRRVYISGNPSTHIYTQETSPTRHNIERLAFFPFLTCQMYTRSVHLFPNTNIFRALTTFSIIPILHNSHSCFNISITTLKLNKKYNQCITKINIFLFLFHSRFVLGVVGL